MSECVYREVYVVEGRVVRKCVHVCVCVCVSVLGGCTEQFCAN